MRAPPATESKPGYTGGAGIPIWCFLLPLRLLVLHVMGLCGAIGCAQEPRDPVVAVVGERQITAEELRRFVLDLPPGLLTEEEGKKAREDYLQTLIDREILLLEARNQGLERDPELLKKLSEKKKDHILSIFSKREIRPHVAVSEEEIRRFFEERGLGRERLVARILVETEEKVQQLLARIQAGDDFPELVRIYSSDPGAARREGLGGFVNRLTAERLGIPAAVFDTLETEAVSSPLPAGNGYQVIRFVEDRSADLETYYTRIRQQLLKEKRRNVEAQKVELLAYELGWELNSAGLAVLRRGTEALEDKTGPAFTPEEKEVPLFTYKQGQVTVDDYIERLRAIRIKTDRALRDSTFIAAVGERFILPPTMLIVAAERLGIPQEPQVMQWIEKQREELLLLQVRQREVGDSVSVSEEEVRQFYEENRDKFRLPQTVCFDEFLAETEQQARKIGTQIETDTSLLQLSEKNGAHIRRRGADSLACMNKHHAVAYPQLWEALKATPVGAVGGPVLAREGYSIFKVFRREEERQQPFDQARWRARASLVQRRERVRFDEWLLELRRKYRDQVSIYAERLTEALPEALMAGSAEEI